jgi:hypothetical protein
MINNAKTLYYYSIIAENSSNQKVLFNTVDKLLYRKPEKRYPTDSLITSMRKLLQYGNNY